MFATTGLRAQRLQREPRLQRGDRAGPPLGRPFGDDEERCVLFTPGMSGFWGSFRGGEMRLTAHAAVLVAVLSTVLAGVVTGRPAGAAVWVTRTVTTTYSGPSGFSAGAPASPVVTSHGPWVATTHNEVLAKVSAVDETGNAVLVAVEYVPPSSASTAVKTWCGSTPTIAVSAGSQLRSEVLAGRCDSGQPSVPTTGSITVQLLHPVVPRPRVVPPAGRWAVVIGIRDYAAPTEPTYGGDGDVAAVVSGLRHAGWLSSHILVLRDGAASAGAILSAMRWLVARSSPSTFTLFHYSGHVCIASRGPCASGHTYLWGADNGFIPESAVSSQLGRLRGRAWVDIAGCEAGAFSAGIASRKRLFTGSSQPGRTSYEEPSWHESVWSGTVWDRGFNRGGAAGGRPFAASIGQMVRYGVRNTEQITNGQSAGQQRPFVSGGDGRWRLSAPPA